MTPIVAPGTYNVRDIACGTVRSGRLLRSASLDGLTDRGVAALASAGVRTVVDLRDDTEKRCPATEHPWTVVPVPLYDPATGVPTRGDIAGVYRTLLHERGTQVTAAVRAIARSRGATLVHCTAGKDRTGLVVALALSAAGVPRDEIAADYSLSGNAVREHRATEVGALLAAQPMTGAEVDAALVLHLDSPAHILDAALDDVDERYGSASGYLLAHGFTAGDLRALTGRLCAPAALTVLHLSDVHATTDGALYRHVDGIGRLHHVTRRVAESTVRPDAVVLTGDLCQSGEQAVYPAVAEAVSQMGAELDCPVLALPGNHDHRPSFAASFGEERVIEVGGHRIIGLDTGDGVLDAGQLEWLRSQLSRPAPAGTVLAMHHPPIAAAAASLVGRELSDPAALAHVIEGTDVRAVLAGHFHHPMSGTLAGVPVWVGGSLAYLQHTGLDADTVVGLDGPSYSVVRVDEHATSCVPVPLTEPPVLFRTSPSATLADPVPVP